ncbi:hypothetical protein F3D3_1330 [Fusibacter sp. 3D3]|nr:hypothetical protein F3D3_1330 [Fusibacter sp. 3D3]
MRTQDFNKKQLRQKGLALPYAIKHSTDNYGRLDDYKESDENSAVLATDEGVSLARKVIHRSDKTKKPRLKFETSKDKLNAVSKQEAYDWYILKINLDTSDLNQIFTAKLNEDEEDFLRHLFQVKEISLVFQVL